VLSELENLQLLDDSQFKLDAAQRKLQSSQWLLFAEWWKFVSDVQSATNIGKKPVTVWK
jgi:hypothetical protein